MLSKFSARAFCASAILALAVNTHAAVTIDTFNRGDFLLTAIIDGSSDSLARNSGNSSIRAGGMDVIGDEREAALTNLGGFGAVALQMRGGVIGANAFDSASSLQFTYDGIDGGSASGPGLGGLDATEGGSNDVIMLSSFRTTAAAAGGTLNVTINEAETRSFLIPGSTNADYGIPLTAFSTGFDIVDSLSFEFLLPAGGDMRLGMLGFDSSSSGDLASLTVLSTPEPSTVLIWGGLASLGIGMVRSRKA